MKANRLFDPPAGQVERLVAGHPFALLASNDGAGGVVATPLPLLLQRDDGGAALLGHFARANPQVALLRERPRALAAFLGEHGYMSPSWLADRTQAPTWNYETVHFEVEVEFDDSPEAARDVLERLVAHMEHGRPGAWSTADMGARYQRMAGAVVAFHARVLGSHAKFKLGQNERDDVRDDMVAGLLRTGQPGLAAAMVRANARPAPEALSPRCRAGSPA